MAGTTKTVRVTIYVSEAGGLAVGILTREHRGAVRLDRRHRSARPSDLRLAAAPRGVDPVVWAAYVALERYVDECVEEARSRPH